MKANVAVLLAYKCTQFIVVLYQYRKYACPNVESKCVRSTLVLQYIVVVQQCVVQNSNNSCDVTKQQTCHCSYVPQDVSHILFRAQMLFIIHLTVAWAVKVQWYKGWPRGQSTRNHVASGDVYCPYDTPSQSSTNSKYKAFVIALSKCKFHASPCLDDTPLFNSLVYNNKNEIENIK